MANALSAPAMIAAALLATLAASPCDLAGMTVALHPEEAARRGFEYPPDLLPIVELGARAISVPVSLYVDTITAREVRTGTVPDDDLLLIFARARALGLCTVLMPLIEVRSGPQHHWRGVLNPADPGAWWKDYRRWIQHYAALAAKAHVDVLVIGSELTSLSGPESADRWREVSEHARQVFKGQLAYVTNHDALHRTAPFAHVDLAGVSAYFPLGDGLDLTEAQMTSAWANITEQLRVFAGKTDRPLILFELGYPSLDGGAARPWDYTRGTVIDLEEQRAAYLAATDAILRAPFIRGALFWTWFGPGGPHDRWYTPRGKPAEAVLRAFYRGSTSRTARNSLEGD